MNGTDLLAEMRRRGAGLRLVTWMSPVLIDGEPRDVSFE